MAYIQGRVQSATTGNGVAYAFIRDNFNNTANCDQYGLFYSYYAYFPGYQITGSAGGYSPNTHEITSAEWGSGFMTIRLTPVETPTTSCFTGETPVLMADESSRSIDQVGVGDWVRGRGGERSRVSAVETPRLNGRFLYALNGGLPFVTSEHPFLTSDGWKSIDPAETTRENGQVVVARLDVGDRLLACSSTMDVSHGGGVAVAVDRAVELVTLTSISRIAADPEMTVYNLILEDGHEYVANGFVVHNKGW